MAGAWPRVNRMRFCSQVQHLVTPGVGVGESAFVAVVGRFGLLRAVAGRCGAVPGWGGDLSVFPCPRSRFADFVARDAVALCANPVAREGKGKER